MKSSNLWRIIWIVGIYLLLGIILYLVILYKVEWEYKDLNSYLYLYDCGNDLCTSTIPQNNYYSKILCDDDVCPYIVDIIGDNLILKNNNKSWLYNYNDNKIVNDKYFDYRYIGNDMYVVADQLSDQSIMNGVINKNGEVLVPFKYDYIDNYKNDFISYVKNNLYGIVSNDGLIDTQPIYEDVVLINDKIFAGMKDNIYHLYSYNDINNENANKYNYVYAYDDIIFVVNNKKIDILDSNLNSTLLMKIDTFYEYTTEKERGSLKIFVEDGYINFKVFLSENNYTVYKYNIKSKKLV